MTYTPDQVAHLERINYHAIEPAAAATPGLALDLRDDVVLTASQAFPAPDTTHACLLRTTPDGAEALLDEVLGFFAAQELPPTVFISPACQPAGWDARLRARGFAPAATPEAWMVLTDLDNFVFHSGPRDDLALDRVTPATMDAFAATFLAAFEMPGEYAPALAALMGPSVTLPDTSHYLARLGDEPVGTISLVRYGEYGVLGSAGVMPQHRRGRVLVDLFRTTLHAAQDQGISTLFAQTEQGSKIQGLMLTNNFVPAFTRTAYTLASA